MKKAEWRKKYINRLITLKLSRREANQNYRAGDHDFKDNPIDQADDLVSYYCSGG